MGRIREFTDKEETTAASTASISEALLFTTMYIVGLPVEVHIKDGSIFSGIFHTASFDKGYGLFLAPPFNFCKNYLFGICSMRND